MVLDNIEKLLEKYENGETSLKEEQQLKHYFTQGTVAPHLEMYKPMFEYFLVNKQDRFTKDVPFKTKRNFNYKWISVASVAALMLRVYVGTFIYVRDFGNYADPLLTFISFSTTSEIIS